MVSKEMQAYISSLDDKSAGQGCCIVYSDDPTDSCWYEDVTFYSQDLAFCLLKCLRQEMLVLRYRPLPTLTLLQCRAPRPLTIV